MFTGPYWADLLVRNALRERFQFKEEEMLFEASPYGKPYLPDREDICFNMTHSGNWVGCAVGQSPMGIDIEQISPIDLSVAKRMLSSEEYAALCALPAESRLD